MGESAFPNVTLGYIIDDPACLFLVQKYALMLIYPINLNLYW